MLAFQYVFGHDNLARFASDIALVGEPSCVGDDGDEMDETDNETGTRRLFERRLVTSTHRNLGMCSLSR